MFPCGEVPDTSDVDHLAGVTVAELVVAPVGLDGTVCFSSFAATHLVVDVSGYVEG